MGDRLLLLLLHLDAGFGADEGIAFVCKVELSAIAIGIRRFDRGLELAHQEQVGDGCNHKGNDDVDENALEVKVEIRRIEGI